MPIPFPALTPSSRTVTPAQYNTKINEFSRGITFEVLLGNIPTESVLVVTFANISDTQVAAVLTSFVNSRGGFHAVALPASIFAGFELAELNTLVRDPTGLSWHFKGPPQVESVIPGFSTVKVEFIATLDPFGATEVRYDLFTDIEIYAYDTSVFFQDVELTTDLALTASYTYESNVLALAELVSDFQVTDTYTLLSVVGLLPDLVTDFEIVSVL